MFSCHLTPAIASGQGERAFVKNQLNNELNKNSKRHDPTHLVHGEVM